MKIRAWRFADAAIHKTNHSVTTVISASVSTISGPPLSQKSVKGQEEETNMSKTSMSLENISQPGRPGLDELVPSRYALKVGAIDVLVVSDGVGGWPRRCLSRRSWVPHVPGFARGGFDFDC